MSSSVAHDPGISTVSTWIRGARSAALQSSRRETALAAGAVSLLCAVLVYLTWHRWGGIDTDSGYDIAAGTRVAHGQLPYADFVYYYGPLAPMLAGLAVWIGGSGMAAAAVLGFCVGAAILSSVFILSHRLADRSALSSRRASPPRSASRRRSSASSFRIPTPTRSDCCVSS